ncbi:MULTISPECIES: helix-turn-helix transcriptional regulator, partial [unclassified Streptomyces]|uniref:helix-turn-helix transcriptional regulator n=1 Tax=unclassified Streptomyces TaxID=2593676 RepID=UPI000DC42C94
MSDFDAIDSLLASVAPEAELPDIAARRALREQAGLSKAQVARALGVSPSTVGGWETGRRDPSGEVRTKYAYLLDGLAAKFAPEPAEPEQADDDPPAAEDADHAHADADDHADAVDADDVEVLSVPEPCVLCGNPAEERVAGFPQHLDPADCRPGTPATPAAAEEAAPVRTRQEPARPAEKASRGARTARAADRPRT